MCVPRFSIFVFLIKQSYSARTPSANKHRALRGQSCEWLSDAIIQTLSIRTFLMWSGVPDCRISSDCVFSIYNRVNSEAALTSMMISVSGSHLLLYSWLARFSFLFLAIHLTLFFSKSFFLTGCDFDSQQLILGWHFVFCFFPVGLRTAHRKETGKFRWKG